MESGYRLMHSSASSGAKIKYPLRRYTLDWQIDNVDSSGEDAEYDGV